MRGTLRAGLCAIGLVAAPTLAEPNVKPSDRVKTNVVIRPVPGSEEKAGKLLPGEQAELISEIPGWYQVRLANGTMGYVSKTWTVLVNEEGQPGALIAGPMKVHVIDVGTGLAIFIEGPGFTMLYDAGSQDDLATGVDNRVLAYIRTVRPGLATIDHLVLSHPHKDHLELMPDVFDAMAVRHVWDSGAVNKTRGYCRFLRKAAIEPGVQYHNATTVAGDHRVTFAGKTCSGEVVIRQSSKMSDQPVRLGPSTTMTILWRDASRHRDPNENSVVVRLDHGANRILLAGDAEAGERPDWHKPPGLDHIEGALINCCAAALKADVLVVGHHGSLTSSRREFLNAVGARTFVVSSGPHSYRGVVLPDKKVTDELDARGDLYRTDIDDEACELDETKIGLDADESPGGCDNVVIIVPTTGSVSMNYNRLAD